MAKRFAYEALKRREEIDEASPYIRKILGKLPEILSQEDKMKLAEDALTYSVIIQNYTLKNLRS
ncbi:MAG: hypothetical protein WD187_02860 [Candidatus Woykebacteria bacterium]